MSLDSSAPPPAHGAGSPRNSGTLRQGGLGGRAAERGAGPLPLGGGSSPRVGGSAACPGPGGGGGVKCMARGGGWWWLQGPPPGRGGQRAWPPPPGRRSSQHAGRRAGAGLGRRSWRRVPAYTPGGDFSVMPLSTSSIRSSSITTAGTGGARGRGDATVSAPLSTPALTPFRLQVCPRVPGSRAKGVQVGTIGVKGGGSPPCLAWVGAASPLQPAAASGWVIREGGGRNRPGRTPPPLCGRR